MKSSPFSAASIARWGQRLHCGPGTEVGGSWEELDVFCPEHQRQNASRDQFYVSTPSPAPFQVRPSVSWSVRIRPRTRTGFERRNLSRYEWLARSAELYSPVCVCMCECGWVGWLCGCVLKWEVYSSSSLGEWCPLDVATCAAQNT